MLSRLSEMIRQRRGRKALYSSEAYWNSKAAKYDDTAVSMWPNRSLNELYEVEQKGMIDRHISTVDNRHLLDMGCGTGRFSRWFAQRGAHVTGIDFSQGSLDIAARMGTGSNPEYRHGSVFDLADEAAYDVVFTWGVLTIACTDTEQLKTALVRIRRSIRPGGLLLLTEPVHRGFLHRVLDLDLVDFVRVMREAGFEVNETSPLHFWPMRLALAYVPWPGWVTVPLYHLGQQLMKVPGLSTLGDYWAIVARPVVPAVPAS